MHTNDEDFVLLKYKGNVQNKTVGSYVFEIGVPVPVLRKDAIAILGKSSGVNFSLVGSSDVNKDKTVIIDKVNNISKYLHVESHNNFMIVSFYTKNTPYEEEVERLRASLVKFNLPFYIEAIESKGSWVKNCNLKPEFCRRMLDKYNMPIIWLDSDAEILKFPELFNNLNRYDIAVAKSGKVGKPNEILSGTLFFNNTLGAKTVLNSWVKECNKYNIKWDQKNLQEVIESNSAKIKIFDLPLTYVKIFDNRNVSDKDVVIVHWQASRKYKRII